MKLIRLGRIGMSLIRRLSIEECFIFFRRFLFRSEKVVVFVLEPTQLSGIAQEEYDAEAVKGDLHWLRRVSEQINPVPWEFLCHEFDGVKDFFVVLHDGEIKHISWIYFQNDPNRILKLGEREIEIKYCLTLPMYRGRGLFPKTLRTIARYYFSRGFQRIFITINADNSSSIRGAEKAGFRRIGETKEIKAFGIQLSRRVSFDKG